MNSFYVDQTIGFDAKLGHLIEEAGEMLAAAGKTLRWGKHSTNPELPPNERKTNLAWLIREMDDVETAIKRLKVEISFLPLPEAES